MYLEATLPCDGTRHSNPSSLGRVTTNSGRSMWQSDSGRLALLSTLTGHSVLVQQLLTSRSYCLATVLLMSKTTMGLQTITLKNPTGKATTYAFKTLVM